MTESFLKFYITTSEAEGLIHSYIYDMKFRQVIITVKGYNNPQLSHAFWKCSYMEWPKYILCWF